MSRRDERERTGSIVAAVVAEAVREAGAAGVVLAAPRGPERSLLEGWLGDTVRVGTPDDSAVEAAAEALGGDPAARRAAVHAVAGATAERNGFLIASGVTKTVLLLDGPGPGDLHPLGDVWASQVEAWQIGSSQVEAGRVAAGPGSVRRPRALPDGVGLDAVDAVLRAWLEEGETLARALGRIPPDDASKLERLLRPSLRGGRPPIVPKLTDWTPGVDPPV